MNKINMTLWALLGICFTTACTHKDGKYCKVLPAEDFVLNVVCESYDNGILRKYESFINDSVTRNGPYFEFSENGDTLIKAFYHSNAKIRNYYEYYSADKFKSYVYLDFNSDTLYYREYDLNSEIVKEGGDLFHKDGYTGISTLDLDTDSIVEVISTVITPPRAKFKINSFVTLDTDSSTDTIRPIQQGYMPDEDNGIYSIRIKIENQGKYRIYVDSELEDPDKGKTWRKTEGYKFSFCSE